MLPTRPYMDVPPAVAARIGVDYQKSVVIISSWDPAHGQLHTTTWGSGPSDKLLAANGGVICAKALGADVDRSQSFADYRVDAFVDLHKLRPLSEWHDDLNTVLWWKLPIDEPPYVGTPQDSGWPGCHTHWSPLPDCKLLVATDGAPICRL